MAWNLVRRLLVLSPYHLPLSCPGFMIETRSPQLPRMTFELSFFSQGLLQQMYSAIFMTVLCSSNTSLAWHHDLGPYGTCGVTYMCGCYGGGYGISPAGIPPVNYSPGGIPPGGIPPGGCSACASGSDAPSLGAGGYFPADTAILYSAPPDSGGLPAVLPTPGNYAPLAPSDVRIE